MLTWLLSLHHFSYGQDSSRVFTQENLFWYLTSYHPVSRQAAIQIEKGENEVRKAKGLLDPFLFSTINKKEFNQQEYYSLFSGGLTIPTWYNIDFNAGFYQNQGINLNPETRIPTSGLMLAGVSVSVGQGLFIDKRRAAIKQATLYAKSTFAEQQVLLNNLYYDASIAFLNWTNHFNQMQLYQNTVDLANERFIGVKQSFIGGDVPAIDTLEAFTLVQMREVNLNQAKLNYQNATLELSNYLWFENNTPLEITDQLRPPLIEKLSTEQTISLDSLHAILETLKTEHPEMQLYTYKLNYLDVERRWNAEQLKPILNIKYNLLNEPVAGDALSGFSVNNYIFGLDFSVPIFLRESRGRLNITKFNIQETKYDVDMKWLELTNKVKRYHNELEMLERQIQLFNSAASNYFKLLEAEQRKFSMGESSIFLMNTREAAYVNAAISLIQLNIKYQTAVAEFKLASAKWF